MIQTEGSNICRIDIFLMNIFILFMKLSCSSKKNLNFHIHLFACWVIAGLIVLSGNISKKILPLTGDLSSYHFSLQSTLQMIQNILMAQLSESKVEIKYLLDVPHPLLTLSSVWVFAWLLVIMTVIEIGLVPLFVGLAFCMRGRALSEPVTQNLYQIIRVISAYKSFANCPAAPTHQGRVLL